jgi:Rieske 2Fe-2S family protein
VPTRLQPGNRTVVELAGESVLITRDLDGQLHALANVCRHRGARLCDQHSDSGQGSLMCPYHAWTYALDGRLIATPHLDDDDIDKASFRSVAAPCARVAGLRVRQPRQGPA